jgi:hypothetical protein
MKLQWMPGIPTQNGIYWFDNGVSFIKHFSEKRALICFVINGKAHFFNKYGAMPLSLVFNPTVCVSPRWAAIPPPKFWQQMQALLPQIEVFWVLHKENYLGLGLLDKDWGRRMSGSIAWLTHPDLHTETNTIIRMGSGYMFAPLPIPYVT